MKVFFRVSGFVVLLPPLRERSDKDRLLDLLLREAAAGAKIRLEAGVRERLLVHSWLDNVRQLRPCLRTPIALSLEECITLDDLMELLPATPAITKSDDNPLGASERQTLLTMIEREYWHIAHVDARPGISRNMPYRKLRQYSISRPG